MKYTSMVYGYKYTCIQLIEIKGHTNTCLQSSGIYS